MIKTGEIIKQKLVNRGIQQKWLAGEIGVTEQQLSLVLAGKRKLTAEELYKMSDALKMSTDELLGKEVKKLSFEGVGANSTRTELLRLWEGLKDMLGTEAQNISDEQLDRVLDILEIIAVLDGEGLKKIQHVLENIKEGKKLNPERLKTLELISSQLK